MGDRDRGAFDVDLELMRRVNKAGYSGGWTAHNNGASKRNWFLTRGGGPIPDEYHCDRNGDLIRYTMRGAYLAADKMNKAL